MSGFLSTEHFRLVHDTVLSSWVVVRKADGHAEEFNSFGEAVEHLFNMPPNIRAVPKDPA